MARYLAAFPADVARAYAKHAGVRALVDVGMLAGASVSDILETLRFQRDGWGPSREEQIAEYMSRPYTWTGISCPAPPFGPGGECTCRPGRGHRGRSHPGESLDWAACWGVGALVRWAQAGRGRE